MTISRRFLLVAAMVPTLALCASCGEKTPFELGEVLRSVLEVTVTPSPVEGIQNTLTGTVTASYQVTVTERAGLGGKVLFIAGSVFDPASGRQVAQNYYETADLVVFLGTSRIEPQGSLSMPQNQTYLLPDLSKAALLTISVQFKDDRDNIINASTLVNLQ